MYKCAAAVGVFVPKTEGENDRLTLRTTCEEEKKEVFNAQAKCTRAFMPEPYANISRACSLKVLQRLYAEKV